MCIPKRGYQVSDVRAVVGQVRCVSRRGGGSEHGGGSVRMRMMVICITDGDRQRRL